VDEGAAETLGTRADAATPIAVKKRSGVLRPLSESSYELRVTVRAETREKLAQATDLLRHVVPDGSVAEVVDRALTVLLRDLARRKFAETGRAKEDGETAKRRPAGHSHGTTSQTRHIPARIRRAVWRRDGGQCAFVGKAAGRCGERGFLEFHHVHPYAAGGAATIENIALRCRAHNGHEAEVFYGRRFMRRLQPGPQPNSFRNELQGR